MDKKKWRISLLITLFFIASGSMLIRLRLISYPGVTFAAPGLDANAPENFYWNLAEAAFERTKSFVVYDGSYAVLDYPGGDVPPDRGVCTDVVVRSYRKMGIDLQKLVHEDMTSRFSEYPQIWGMKGPDKNIDHRRVPNLMKFFERYGQSLKATGNPKDYRPGDIVAYRLDNGRTHIGMVTNRMNLSRTRYLLVHNIGAGPKAEDCLFDWEILGHYRYGG